MIVGGRFIEFEQGFKSVVEGAQFGLGRLYNFVGLGYLFSLGLLDYR